MGISHNFVKYGNIEVNTQGFVKTIRKGIYKGRKDKDGYLIVTCNGCPRKIHRIVAELFIPNPENKQQVNHIDGNKSNNDVSNLEWVTGSENMKHCWKMGLTKGKHRSVTILDKRDNKIYKFNNLHDCSKHFGKSKKFFSNRINSYYIYEDNLYKLLDF